MLKFTKKLFDWWVTLAWKQAYMRRTSVSFRVTNVRLCPLIAFLHNTAGFHLNDSEKHAALESVMLCINMGMLHSGLFLTFLRWPRKSTRTTTKDMHELLCLGKMNISFRPYLHLLRPTS